MVLISISAITILVFFPSNVDFQMVFKRFHKLNFDKLGYYYLRSVFLNPQQKFRLLSQLSVKIPNIGIHTF